VQGGHSPVSRSHFVSNLGPSAVIDEEGLRLGFELFEVSIEEQEGRIIARLGGELDLAGREHFKNVVTPLMARAAGGTLVIDLSGLTFMDSTGLTLLLELDAESRRDGFALSIVKGPPQVHRALEISGLDAILPMAPE